MVNWNKRGLKKLKFWKIILWSSQWGRLIGHNLTPFGLPTSSYVDIKSKREMNWIEYYDCKILKCINFWYKILVFGGGLFWLTLKKICGIKNVNPNVKVIHFFASKENQINFACQHCSLSFFLHLSRRHTDHCSF